MTSRLLNVASVVCLVLCVALMGMWVRSYRSIDELHAHLTERKVFIISSIPGRLYFDRDTPAPPGNVSWWWICRHYPILPEAAAPDPQEVRGLFESLGFAVTADSYP